MKNLILMLAAVSLLAFLGCGEKGGDANEAAETAETTAGTAHGADDGHGHDHADAQVAHTVGDAVKLSGTLGCGHCNFSTGDGCSAALQTTDGVVYILDVDQGHEAFQNRMDGGSAQVAGAVKSTEPLMVTVESITM